MNKNLDILKNINILYLEDDENLLKHTSDILEDFVANIYGVKNTIDAMKILLEKKVDVIISDILLENENGTVSSVGGELSEDTQKELENEYQQSLR